MARDSTKWMKRKKKEDCLEIEAKHTVAAHTQREKRGSEKESEIVEQKTTHTKL